MNRNIREIATLRTPGTKMNTVFAHRGLGRSETLLALFVARKCN